MGIVFHYYYYNDYMFELYDFQCVQCMFSKAILDDLLPHQIKYCLFWQIHILQISRNNYTDKV